jgi:hypothetical protein
VQFFQQDDAAIVVAELSEMWFSILVDVPLFWKKERRREEFE